MTCDTYARDMCHNHHVRANRRVAYIIKPYAPQSDVHVCARAARCNRQLQQPRIRGNINIRTKMLVCSSRESRAVRGDGEGAGVDLFPLRGYFAGEGCNFGHSAHVLRKRRGVITKSCRRHLWASNLLLLLQLLLPRTLSKS